MPLISREGVDTGFAGMTKGCGGRITLYGRWYYTTPPKHRFFGGTDFVMPAKAGIHGLLPIQAWMARLHAP
jgi:hypothetical protein